MKISNTEIMDAISSNDLARVKEILDGFDLRKDGKFPVFTHTQRSVVETMLGDASAQAYINNLDAALAEELIERTAITVNLFQLLRFLADAKIIDTTINPELLPEGILEAFGGEYSCVIVHTIEEMDDEAFETLLASLATANNKRELRIHARFILPIIRRIYKMGLVPTTVLLAFMGLSLDDPIRESRLESYNSLGDFLGMLFSELYEDEEEEEEEDEEE